jgi:hypothetical protein
VRDLETVVDVGMYRDHQYGLLASMASAMV